MFSKRQFMQLGLKCAGHANWQNLKHDCNIKRFGKCYKVTPKTCAQVNCDNDLMSENNVSVYVINYAGCSVLWSSKLQTEKALLIAESEYIALSTAMRDVIPLMQLLTEINCIFPIHNPEPKIHCKVFEDMKVVRYKLQTGNSLHARGTML